MLVVNAELCPALNVLTIFRMFDLIINIDLASSHFVEKREQFGTWIGAVIGYNRGNLDDINHITTTHLINVLSNERKYDRAFVEMLEGDISK